MPGRCLLLAALAALAATANAQTVTFTPGAWEYEASAMLGVLPVTDAGRECLEPGRSTFALSEAAASLQPGCRLVRAVPAPGGYAFDMACTGALTGELSGTLEVEDERARLSAKGWTGPPDSRVPVTVTAKARRVAASCN